MITAKWISIAGARKRHCFYGSERSLCGKWVVFTMLIGLSVPDDSTDNCKVCQRKLSKIRSDPIQDKLVLDNPAQDGV